MQQQYDSTDRFMLRKSPAVLLWAIAALIMLCIVAGLFWIKLDRRAQIQAEEKRELETQYAEFRQQRQEMREVYQKKFEELANERVGLEAREAQLEREKQQLENQKK